MLKHFWLSVSLTVSCGDERVVSGCCETKKRTSRSVSACSFCKVAISSSCWGFRCDVKYSANKDNGLIKTKFALPQIEMTQQQYSLINKSSRYNMTLKLVWPHLLGQVYGDLINLHPHNSLPKRMCVYIYLLNLKWLKQENLKTKARILDPRSWMVNLLWNVRISKQYDKKKLLTMKLWTCHFINRNWLQTTLAYLKAQCIVLGL